jgi:hypothetical protein
VLHYLVGEICLAEGAEEGGDLVVLLEGHPHFLVLPIGLLLLDVQVVIDLA